MKYKRCNLEKIPDAINEYEKKFVKNMILT